VRENYQTELEALQEELVHITEVTGVTTILISRIKGDYAFVSEAAEETTLLDKDLDFRHYLRKRGRDPDVQKMHKWSKH
jgi:C4-dicarboxylate-specific signal transduction histidine kinase